MDDTATRELTEDDIRTVLPGAGTAVKAETEPDTMDGTDGDTTDGKDGDAADEDMTDTRDADGTDGGGGDMDGTDSTS